MTHEIGNLLESVVRITKERDKKSLEKVLLETLADCIEFDALILLRMSSDGMVLEQAAAMPDNAARGRLELLAQDPGDRRIRHDAGIDRCIGGREVVSEGPGGKARVLFPIGINEKIAGILAIYGHESTEITTTLVRGFLRIHGNFLAILDDNERDTLTGLLNRRTFDTRISELISNSTAVPASASEGGAERRRPGGARSHWLSVLDIDHFKKINDTYGHVYGDEVLLLLSGVMKKAFRNTDLLFRYGGEEFVVVLAPADDAHAYRVFERFRQKVEAFDFPQVGRVTVSLGMARIRAEDHSTAVVEHADKALYYAKEHGRNQTCNYHQLIEAGILKEQRYGGEIELF